jgi:hypothetical protein
MYTMNEQDGRKGNAATVTTTSKESTTMSVLNSVLHLMWMTRLWDIVQDFVSKIYKKSLKQRSAGSYFCK